MIRANITANPSVQVDPNAHIYPYWRFAAYVDKKTPAWIT